MHANTVDENNTHANNSHPNKHPVVLCWHMHQPDYRDADGHFQQPWVYLHAIKDYTDMAAHLERTDNCRVVVNFAPILLEQIGDYLHNINHYLETGDPTDLHDTLLAALVSDTLAGDPAVRVALLESCLKTHEHHSIERYATYAALAAFARDLLKHRHRIDYVRESFIFDLLVWYHLAWMGEFIKQQDFRFHRLAEQGQHFGLEQRRQVLLMIRDYLQGVIPRYRALAEAGKVELSMTPHTHPIAPLLIDLGCARQAIPDIKLPESETYPGGEQRLNWHIEQGMKTFAECFGREPAGCWPAEGAIDENSLRVFDRYGFSWVASGGKVLKHSLAPSLHSIGQVPDAAMHAVYQWPTVQLANFFRNDELSDLIGFTYSSWHADDAVGDLIHRLETIAKQLADSHSADNQFMDKQSQDKLNAITVIALDGENAWEYYPNNGYYFLQALYKRLSQHEHLHMRTFSQLVKDSEPARRRPLSKVIAGSWVYGNLSTWIGDEDKNRAWDMLVAAKQCFDGVLAAGELSAGQRELAKKRLGACEGSDWFWWFGDDNPTATTAIFDCLYRGHLTALYQILGRPAPAYLAQPFTHTHPEKALPLGGTMRKAE